MADHRVSATIGEGKDEMEVAANDTHGTNDVSVIVTDDNFTLPQEALALLDRALQKLREELQSGF